MSRFTYLMNEYWIVIPIMIWGVSILHSGRKSDMPLVPQVCADVFGYHMRFRPMCLQSGGGLSDLRLLMLDHSAITHMDRIFTIEPWSSLSQGEHQVNQLNA